MNDRFAPGIATRRAIFGDAHVDPAEAAKTPFDRLFQTMMTEFASGTRLADDTILRRDHSMLTIALLTATGNFEEIPMHMRATTHTGAAQEDVMQALLHVAV